jgi:hypothetical protein
MLRRMSSAWIAIMGSILGGLLASSTALISQSLQAKRERQAKLADARRLAYVEYVQAAHALLEAAASWIGVLFGLWRQRSTLTAGFVRTACPPEPFGRIVRVHL